MRDDKGRFVKGNHVSTEYKTGHIPWSKGQKGVTLNSGRTHFKKGQFTNEKHPFWKGESAGYLAKHNWIRRHYGKPDKCEWCLGTRESKRFEWANLSGHYKRKRSDWLMLCSKCHHQRDNITNRGWITRKGKQNV